MSFLNSLFKKNSKDEKKKKGEESFDVQLMGVDFFSQLSYMASIATSGITRNQLFYRSAQLPYIATRYFRRVDFVAKMFNHDYSQACRIVGEKLKIPEIKAILLRLSNALSSGEDVATFLSRESFIISETYKSNYLRRIDLLRKWSDAYVSLILTSALVTVMSVVTMMIGNVSMGFIVALSAITIIATLFGAWFLYNTAPRETKNHKLPYRSYEQNWVRTMSRIILPIGAVVVVFMIVLGFDIGLIFLVAGAFCAPVGLMAVSDDKKVSKRDDDIGAFLRSLGGTMQAIGATAAEAMGRLDFRSLGMLTPDIKLLHTRLQAGVSPNLCWDRFVGETGSELVNRSVRIFYDGISLGGEAQKVGVEASNFALQISLLRAERVQVSLGFTWLTIAMHGVLVGLSTFVYQIFIAFSTLISTILTPEEGDAAATMPGMSQMGFFALQGTEVQLLHFMIILIIVVLTVANAFSIFSVSGGHSAKLFYYLAITSAISGAILVLVPPVVDMMFKTLA